MKNLFGYALGMASVLTVVGCGGSSSKTTNPAPPTLGAAIDRMGRPAINTALTDPFTLTPASTIMPSPSPGQGEDATKDAYNNAAASAWASFIPNIATNLGVFDGLDTVCGNQFAYTLMHNYTELATVLADDQLYLNSASTTCMVYLGVEANATAIIANSDCGGRTPNEDTIDESYSLLAAGATSGVTDGINSDADGSASLTVFPYLTAPN